MEAQQRAHDDLEKWRQDLRVAAARFLISSREYVKAYQANFVRTRTSNGAVGFRALPNPVANDIRECYEAYWEVVFLCGVHSSEAARQLMRCTRRFQVVLDSGGKVEPLSESQFKKSYTALIESRRSFVGEVRSSLGIASKVDL